MLSTALTSVFFICRFALLINGENCFLDFSTAPEEMPLLLPLRLPDTSGLLGLDVTLTKAGLIYPSTMRDGKVGVLIPDSTAIIISCTGRRNSLEFNRQLWSQLYCEKNKLYLDGHAVHWSQAGCLKRPRATLRRTKRSCGDKNSRGILHTIGWKVSVSQFLPQLTVCFDPEKETTLYVIHKLEGRHLEAKLTDRGRPHFKSGGVFRNSITTAYKKKTQRTRLGKLLKSDRKHYMARGHLAPDGDFIYPAEQDATYFYSNVLPQWQGFNNGNWKALEYDVRTLAMQSGHQLEVWTGGYKTLELPDENNTSIPVNLVPEEGQVPVPAIMWKVVYDPSTKEAVAILGINDIRPHTAKVSYICPDVCQRIRWVDWNHIATGKGRTWCCSVDAMRKLIHHAPDLGKVGLLTESKTETDYVRF